MAVDAELSALMLQTVVWQPRASLNAYGEASFGAAVTVPCRIEQTNKMTLTAEGQEAVSTAQVYTDQVRGISQADQMTLPDGTIPTILTVAVHWDEVGPSHEVVYLG